MSLQNFSLALLILWALLVTVVRWLSRREASRQQADIERYSHWIYPECQLLFGKKLIYTKYVTDDTIECVDRVITRHVNIICPHCHFFNTYDRSGSHQFIPGSPVEFEPDEE